MGRTVPNVYQPLEHCGSIRLLQLTELDDTCGLLYGHLSTSSLSVCPPYKALSYVWGSGQLTRLIRLGDGSVLHITETLFEGLRQLMPVIDNGPIWIDQVCINQEDHVERDQMVSLMGRIFGHADEVIAWLGESSDDIASGINLLKFFGETVSDSVQTDHTRFDAQLDQLLEDMRKTPPLTSIETLFDFSARPWRGAITLVERPWFERLWVVQEVFHARHLRAFCGKLEIGGEVLFTAIRMISSIVSSPPRQVFGAIHRADQLRRLRRSAKEQSYLQLAHSLSRWKCRDDRDRLNALVSIVFGETSIAWFIPTYTLEVNELYSTFARNYIHMDKSLDILHFAGDSRVIIRRDGMNFEVVSVSEPKETVCSWAPDWRIKTRPEPLGPRLRDCTNTKRRPQVTHRFLHSDRVLVVRGYQIDEVVCVGFPLAVGMHELITPDIIFNMWHRLAVITNHDTRHVDQRFASTLIAYDRRSVYDSADQGCSRCLTGFEDWASMVLRVAQSEKPDVGYARNIETCRPKGLDNATLYGYEALKVCMYRSFFITKAGKFGLGPAQTRPNWGVFYLQGLVTPFLLQEASRNDHAHYSLRGECYLEDFRTTTEMCSEQESDIYLV